MALIFNNKGRQVHPSDYSLIRPDMLESLNRYKNGEQYHPFGDFLMYLLSGDFREAIIYADDDNLIAFVALYAWIRNNLPIGIWGSQEKVLAWIRQSLERKRRQDLKEEYTRPMTTEEAINEARGTGEPTGNWLRDQDVGEEQLQKDLEESKRLLENMDDFERDLMEDLDEEE